MFIIFCFLYIRKFFYRWRGVVSFCRLSLFIDPSSLFYKYCLAEQPRYAVTYLPVRFPWILPLIKCTIENWPIPDLLRTTLSSVAACSQAIGNEFAAQVAISCNVFPTENRLERLDFYHIRKRVFLWLPYTNVLVDEYPSMTAKIGEVFTGWPLTWSVFSAHWA